MSLSLSQLVNYSVSQLVSQSLSSSISHSVSQSISQTVSQLVSQSAQGTTLKASHGIKRHRVPKIFSPFAQIEIKKRIKLNQIKVPPRPSMSRSIPQQTSSVCRTVFYTLGHLVQQRNQIVGPRHHRRCVRPGRSGKTERNCMQLTTFMQQLQCIYIS